MILQASVAARKTLVEKNTVQKDDRQVIARDDAFPTSV